MLVISATRDRLVDHTVVRRQGYQRLGSRDKTYVAAKDFGHVDLLIGRRAAREVYPVIGDWLARR